MTPLNFTRKGAGTALILLALMTVHRQAAAARQGRKKEKICAADLMKFCRNIVVHETTAAGVAPFYIQCLNKNISKLGEECRDTLDDFWQRAKDNCADEIQACVQQGYAKDKTPLCLARLYRENKISEICQSQMDSEKAFYSDLFRDVLPRMRASKKKKKSRG